MEYSTKANQPDQNIDTPIYLTNPMLSGYQRPINGVLANTEKIKNGVWLYFFLLIFEGALRKWILPGLSTPLLIIRDPVALWIMIMANKRGLIVMNGYLFSAILISVLGTLTAVLLGHGSILVAIYGARIFLFHFPLVFVIGRVFTREDVLKMGKAFLWISIPMTILVAMQFSSPQSAWVNRGVGGDMEGAGFSGALGYYRPPATFSFISGTVSFYGVVASYIFYFWLTPKAINRPLLIIASVCLIATVPLSISRSLFFEVLISMVFAIVIISKNPKFLSKLLPIVLFSVVAIVILGSTGLFKTSSEAFTERFDTANEQEGGLTSVFLDRFFGGMISALSGSSDIPFFGYGLGMGTNVGAMLLSGKTTFLIAEVEWGRMIGELGPLLGMVAIITRVALVWDLVKKSFKKMVAGDALPWMLLSYGALNLAQGQWAQPSSLGFSVLIGGLILAGINTNNSLLNEK